jgi:lysophospholipase L1-like esterase
MIRQVEVFYALALLAGMLPATATIATPSTAESRLDEPAWAQRHDAKLRDPQRKHVNLLFLGDSITQNYERADSRPWLNYRPVWDHYFANLGAFNLGFSGDTTGNLLWRIQNGELEGLSPTVTVLLIGTNNTTTRHKDWSAAQDASAIVSIIDYVHQRLPMTHIVLVGILPSGQSVWKDLMTTQINRLLQLRYMGQKPSYVTYVDLTSIFWSDGKINNELFVEPRSIPPQGSVHPTAAGQAAMAAALEPIILKWLSVAGRGLVVASGK